MKVSFNWLKWYLPEIPKAEELADIFTYHVCEVESFEKLGEDTIFDIKILPNRAHDLLSHQGVARELAALLDIKFVDPNTKYRIPNTKSTNLKIEIKSDKCRRYMGRIVRNVKVGFSPKWMVKHLESIGQRSINNLVDAANLVMFDCGQPVHAFDLDKMGDSLIIRQAKEGEDLTTLDDRNWKLKSSDLVITDANDVLAVAGIKGGKRPEVDENTQNIILEVANFNPVSIRKTAQSFNIVTDARKRFENDLSPELGSYAMQELSALVSEMCPGAIFEEIVDIYPQKQEKRKLSFRIEKISKILGMKVSVGEVRNILERYNFEYEENKGEFEIVVPSMRLDLNIEEDMAEEIGRIVGYDKIKAKIPEINFKPKANETYAKIVWARNKLLDERYSETMTYTFAEKGEIEVMESASDKKFLRTNLSDGLRESLKLNQVNAPLLGLDETCPGTGGVKIFEIGTIFKKDGEEMHIAYIDKKEIKEMSLGEFCKEVSPDTFARVLGLGPDHSQKHMSSAFTVWSPFPFIVRDVAVWVPKEIPGEQVLKVIKENAGDLVVRGPELFDEFKKDEKISYAFRLVFQSYDRTLTDAEINEVMEKITEKIKEQGWQVR